MSAKILKNDVVDSFSDAVLDDKVIEALNSFKKAVSYLGIDVRIASQASLAKLNEVSATKKRQICSCFQNWTLWILENYEQNKPAEEVEKACLQRALSHYGLKASEDFWKTIGHDQIIEIYGEDMVQLYRSLNFFRITGYSLLDISVFEWYVLWDRPSKAIEETMNDAQKVINEYISVKPFEISNQVIREVYDTHNEQESFVPRAILAKFVNMGSLSTDKSESRVPRGFICTSTAEIIAHGEEAKKIQFI